MKVSYSDQSIVLSERDDIVATEHGDKTARISFWNSAGTFKIETFFPKKKLKELIEQLSEIEKGTSD